MDAYNIFRIILCVAGIAVGVAVAVKPAMGWERWERWKSEGASAPSEMYKRNSRTAGILLAVFCAAFLIKLIWAICTGAGTGFTALIEIG